jgi:hypothetical protein
LKYSNPIMISVIAIAALRAAPTKKATNENNVK